MTASTPTPSAAEIAAAIKRFAMTGSSNGRDDLRVICIKNAALFAEAPAMLAALRIAHSVLARVMQDSTYDGAKQEINAILARIDGETK